ncbi:SpoIVB peptidase precursor [Clostridium vincentii]|uniref:SpoIVB peptidase n=2 Tax=Clostridium vincentii TaxID=52704 RepID=A0A2T0BGK8_9CLOT|nr:SpoIVB peptidase precursor [Clostridium vincentii]
MGNLKIEAKEEEKKMKKNILKKTSMLIAPILILSIITCFSIKNIPKYVYTNNELQVMTSLKAVAPFTKMKYEDSVIKMSIFGVIPVKSVLVKKVDNIEVIPGGNSIGVRLSSNGVLVVGHSEVVVNNEKIESPAKDAGVEIGDLITKANGKKIETSVQLIESVKKSNTGILKLEITRNNENILKEVKLLEEEEDGYKVGLWVRDSTAGVGTMTFYDSKSGKFGALGHPVTDGDTNEPFSIKEGDLLNSSIISVRKGEKGLPGELKGIFQDESFPIGKINKNTQCGIFGEVNKNADKLITPTPLPVAFRDEIELGKATILTTVDESGTKEYEIEIIKLFEQSEPGPKSMIIKITDEKLLQKTGGIVQGMSGSPIIQNGKIIGAVTHVLINKPDVGYGIYIDWMLQDVGLIK